MRNVVRLLAAAVIVGALGPMTMLTTSFEARGEGQTKPDNPFVVLFKGIWEPAVHLPDLGLTAWHDGSYSKVDVYRVSGLPGTTHEAVGTCYFNDTDGVTCVYKLPGGAFKALVTELPYEIVEIDGEFYQIGTAELVIQEATGIYRSFIGGNIHMEFKTHIIDEVTFDEYCVCHISRP